MVIKITHDFFNAQSAKKKQTIPRRKMAEEKQQLAEPEGEEEPKLKLNIKSTKCKDTVEVPHDYTVRQVSRDLDSELAS